MDYSSGTELSAGTSPAQEIHQKSDAQKVSAYNYQNGLHHSVLKSISTSSYATVSAHQDSEHSYPVGHPDDAMRIKMDYIRHLDSPCSPASSNISGQSTSDLHPLTPPTTPYTSSSMPSSSTSPGHRNSSPGSLNLCRSVDLPYTQQQVLSDESMYYHRSESSCFPLSNTHHSHRSGDLNTAKCISKYDPYGIYTQHSMFSSHTLPSTHHQQHYGNHHMVSSTADGTSVASGSSPISHHGQYTPNLVTAFSTHQLDTDVDPKELDQYLDSSGIMKRYYGGAGIGQQIKVDETMLAELQPMAGSSNTDPNAVIVEKIESSINVMSETGSAYNYHESPYQYMPNWGINFPN